MKKILCFRNSKLGDYIISIPSLKIIKKKYSDCKIYYLTSRTKYYNSLPQYIENIKFVEKFIFYENNFQGYVKLIKKLKKLKFDIVFNLQENANIGISHLLRNIYHFLFFYTVGIKKKRGFFSKNLDYSVYSETLQVAKRVEPSINKKKLKKFIYIKKTKDKRLLNYKYLTISIGGFSQPKIWSINNWIILLKLIAKKYNYKIIIIGTKKDIKNSKLLTKLNKKKILSLCGKLNFAKLFNVIKYTKMHITNDNGSMHVAALYDKNTICLFNNHDPEGKWHPLSNKSHIFRDTKGIDNISPYKVYKKLLNII